MEWQPVQYYSRVIMNPPFSHGQDIRHILRAFSLLRPGGVLVAVCLNGPRQQEKLLPFSDVREELPRGTFAYAGAFFRCLNGSRRISLSDLRFFMPSLTAEELRGNRSQWLYAVDVLIETQGEVCLLPLPGDAAERLFPSVRFRVRERSRHKSALVMQKYSRQQAREAEQKARAYQALVAQAEIELAFHSPETVGSWHARWSDWVAEHDLETLFWQWGERFPSLTGMERWQWQDMPFWQVIAEAGMAAREAGHAVREMERWMVPNKLREAA